MFRRDVASKSIVAIVFLALAVVNVYLLLQNRELKARLAGRSVGPAAGQRLPRETGIDVNGNERPVWPDGEHAILLYVSPRCHFCDEQARYWQLLIQNVSDKDLRVIAVMDRSYLDEGPSYLASHGLEMAAPVFLSDKQLEAVFLFSTPTTVILGADGLVEASWIGAWTPEMIVAAEKQFSLEAGTLHLPDNRGGKPIPAS